MYNYDISFPQTDPHSTVCLRSNSRTQTRPYSTIAPHQSSSYPEYLSPTWDKDTQRAVVWMRLQEHRKLANRSLAKINEQYKALRQEQQTQVESRHEPLSRDKLFYVGKTIGMAAETPFKCRLCAKNGREGPSLMESAVLFL